MKFDAIVIGAGPAGSTAALLLARAGWSVAIVEKSAFPRRKVCGEFISAPALELLTRAGIADEVLAGIGPEVREVVVYAGDRAVTGRLPRHIGEVPYGRALGREHLDARLLAAAGRAGAQVWQPGRVESCARGRDLWSVSVRGAARRSNPDAIALHAPIVIAAHGSWDTGRLPVAGRASDFVAFKAHFGNCDLPPHRMPLVAFPGGYAGLVTIDSGRVDFACCIRRDALAACRAKAAGSSAGEAVFAHVLDSTPRLRDAVGNAVREGAWLATGPLRPGIHDGYRDGRFTIGNAHGEAHPIVGEGITMALQSAYLLCERLIRMAPRSNHPKGTFESGRMDAVARDYAAAYRKMFRPRIAAASAFAAIASRPIAARALVGFFAKCPPLFGFCARRAGKNIPCSVDLDALQTGSTS